MGGLFSKKTHVDASAAPHVDSTTAAPDMQVNAGQHAMFNSNSAPQNINKLTANAGSVTTFGGL